MRKKLPAVIMKLRKWREANGGLSARQTSSVMEARGLMIPYHTLESWESGARKPGRFAAEALSKFLEDHPNVDDAPQYMRHKISPEQVTEILALRKQDLTLGAIAQKFNISESSVSRICSGSRRAK
jgi:DNA-binding transcriptional regulator YiaG